MEKYLHTTTQQTQDSLAGTNWIPISKSCYDQDVLSYEVKPIRRSDEQQELVWFIL